MEIANTEQVLLCSYGMLMKYPLRSTQWRDYIAFRDYLSANPDVAREYETVKIRLMNEYKHNRLSYTEGKSECIMDTLREAHVNTAYFGDGGVTVMQDRGLSGSTLKIIAVISMLVDHTFLAIFDKVYIGKKLPMPGLYFQNGLPNHEHWIFGLERVMRGTIGRIAFPIFCFLLVQGFVHTSNKGKYKLRLFVFALLSEIPFNLALWERFRFGASNVLFTLLLGLVSLEVIEKDWHLVVRGPAVVGMVLLADLLGCDYGAAGVLLIVMLYFARDDKVMTVLVGLLAIVASPAFSVMSILAYIPVYFYNGKRGLKLKYVFYAFYPVHLLVLYFIRWAMVRG